MKKEEGKKMNLRNKKKEFQRRKTEQDEDISMLSELKKLKKMDLLNYITNKRKEKTKMTMKMNLMNKLLFK